VTNLAAPDDEARSDRRVVLIALGVMLALVLSGVGIASVYASTSCRHLRPDALAAPVIAVSDGPARTLLSDAGLGTTGVATAEQLLGPIVSAVTLPLVAPLRIGEAPTGVAALVVTGDGAVLVAETGDVVSGATFRRPVTVVGDGVSLFALVVGNRLTGQVDALRPLVPGADGLAPGTCVDTSAVGSPLSFLHDARGGQFVGLRTDEDGSDAVLELRDHVRGRVWAPVVALPRAPAGLQGSRTSGALGPDTVIVVRRIALGTEDPSGAVRAFQRSDGSVRWELDAVAVRAVLPLELAEAPTLRLEVAHVDAQRALVVVYPDVPVDALLPPPTYGPLGELADPDPRTSVLTLDLRSGAIRDVTPGPAPVGRDGAERDALRAALGAAGVVVDDVLGTPEGTWVLVGRVLVRFGG
jgi:hypothetical protein